MYAFDSSKTGIVGTPNGKARTEGHGKLDMVLVSETGDTQHVTLHDVAYVPSFKMNLFSLSQAASNGRYHRAVPGGNNLEGTNMFFKNVGNIPRITAYREMPDCEANATLSPGSPSPVEEVDINVFHCSYGHVHETLLHDTAKQLGITLRGELSHVPDAR